MAAADSSYNQLAAVLSDDDLPEPDIDYSGLDEVSGTKVRALIAEGRVAILENDPGRCLKLYIGALVEIDGMSLHKGLQHVAGYMSVLKTMFEEQKDIGKALAFLKVENKIYENILMQLSASEATKPQPVEWSEGDLLAPQWEKESLLEQADAMERLAVFLLEHKAFDLSAQYSAKAIKLREMAGMASVTDGTATLFGAAVAAAAASEYEAAYGTFTIITTFHTAAQYTGANPEDTDTPKELGNDHESHRSESSTSSLVSDSSLVSEKVMVNEIPNHVVVGGVILVLSMAYIIYDRLYTLLY